MTGSFLNQARSAPRARCIYIEAPLLTRWSAGLSRVKSLSVGPGMSPEAFINPLVSALTATRCRPSG